MQRVMRYIQTTFVFILQPCSEKRYAVSDCGRFPYLQGTAVRYRVLTVVLHIAVRWVFQNGEMRSQESNYMYSSFTKSTIKNQNTQLTEKSVGITIQIFSDYPIEKSQYPINKKMSGYYPIHQNFLSGALFAPVHFASKVEPGQFATRAWWYRPISPLPPYIKCKFSYVI